MKEFTCSLCNASFSGEKTSKGAEDVFFKYDDLKGYACAGCQAVFCTRCAQSKIIHTFASSPCPQCQASFTQAAPILMVQTGLFQAQALKQQVDADDGGGSFWFGPSVITLFPNEIHILSQYRNTPIGQSEIVPLNKISGVEVFAYCSDDELGRLEFTPRASGILGRFLALLPKVYFNKQQELRVRELADKINQALNPQSANARNSVVSQEKNPSQSASNPNESERHSGTTHTLLNDLAVLEKLSVLHEKGILTDKEFAAKKTQILGL